ncbi:hypothetical protein ABIA39_009123, partial [Nocardia sp. GAS34]
GPTGAAADNTKPGYRTTGAEATHSPE